MVNTTVNILFAMSKICRSRDHGGILGLSIANVIQLLAMKTKMIKSNQDCSVKVLQRSRNLKHKNGKAPLVSEIDSCQKISQSIW